MAQLFEAESKAFQEKLPELLQHSAGKFALVKGDRVDSVWTTYEDAIQAGYRAFGLDQFMVKRIEAVESVVRVTRFLVPQCRS